jgi:hypothetical protein
MLQILIEEANLWEHVEKEIPEPANPAPWPLIERRKPK